jgi:hypothetical protein
MPSCYICSSQQTTDDHIPPQCIFPEKKDLPPSVDYRKNLITVPACADHNLRRSNDDEYLLYMLASNANVNDAGLRQWLTKARRALSNFPGKKRWFPNLRPLMVRGVLRGGFSVDAARLVSQFERIARGLYFFDHRRPWSRDVDIFTSLIISVGGPQSIQHNQTMHEAARLARIVVSREPRLGENPEIFYYQIKLTDDGSGFLMLMVFYGGIEVVARSNWSANAVKSA